MTGMTLETRTRAVEALRTTTVRQSIGYSGTRSGSQCGNAVIAGVLGCLPEQGDVLILMEFRDALQAVGIPTLEIVERNDGVFGHRRHTFAELADWLEHQPVIDGTPDTVPEGLIDGWPPNTVPQAWLTESQVVS